MSAVPTNAEAVELAADLTEEIFRRADAFVKETYPRHLQPDRTEYIAAYVGAASRIAAQQLRIAQD